MISRGEGEKIGLWPFNYNFIGQKEQYRHRKQKKFNSPASPFSPSDVIMAKAITWPWLLFKTFPIGYLFN